MSDPRPPAPEKRGWEPSLALTRATHPSVTAALQRSGKKHTRKEAIGLKCMDCVGADQDPDVTGRIRACPVYSCPLWPVRPYQGAQ